MIILASKSKTRIELLQNAGLNFTAQAARIDERKIEAEQLGASFDQPKLTAKLADTKAIEVSQRRPQAFVIGADQTLSINNSYLHKPTNLAALRQQLDALKGKTHRLCAAVSLAQNGKIIWQHQGLAHLTMHSFTNQERDQVIELEGDKLLQSVGGYRLEGPSIRFFKQIDGDYFTILGLPLLPLLSALREKRAI